jgi:hypothetical protein
MNMSEAKRPEILRGVNPGVEVRFTYTTKDGASAYVSGRVDRFTGTEADGVTGIAVRLSVSSRLPGCNPSDVVILALARITPDPETGLIVPVSKKERATGTGAARFLGPSEKQVRYALSLCDRDGDLGGGNFYRPTEAEFRGMTPRKFSEWIAMAREELGI